MRTRWLCSLGWMWILIISNACLGPSREPTAVESSAGSDEASEGNGNNNGNGDADLGDNSSNLVTYNSFVAEFMERSCHGVGCHSGANAVAPPLETYDDLVLYWEQSLDSMQAGRMPIGLKEDSMTPEDVENFAAWVEAEFPEGTP